MHTGSTCCCFELASVTIAPVTQIAGFRNRELT